MKWTDEGRNEAVRRWLEEGLSIRDVQTKFGGFPTVTHNMVCGLRFRLGIRTTRTRVVKIKPRVNKLRPISGYEVRRDPRPGPKPLPEMVNCPGQEPVYLVDLEDGMCRYIVGHDGAALYCGAEASGQFCWFHEKRVRP